MITSCSWTFTSFNTLDIDSFLSFFKSIGEVAYFVCGRELTPSTLKKHLQGYVRFKDSVSFDSLTSFDSSVHYEVAKGSDFQNFAYCSKDADFVEFGRKSGKNDSSSLLVYELLEKICTIPDYSLSKALFDFPLLAYKDVGKFKAFFIEFKNACRDLQNEHFIDF